MKKFWLQLGGAVLAGLIISFGLSFLVPNWTRSDMISVFTLIVAVWTAGATRWDYLRQGESPRKPTRNQTQNDRDNRTGSVHFTLEKRSSSTFDLFARNIGKEDIKKVTIKTTPFGNAPMPSFTSAYAYPVPLLKPHEKVLISNGSFDRSAGISFEIEAVWKDPSGRIQKRNKTMKYN